MFPAKENLYRHSIPKGRGLDISCFCYRHSIPKGRLSTTIIILSVKASLTSIQQLRTVVISESLASLYKDLKKLPHGTMPF
jgi:hypothetical protein